MNKNRLARLTRLASGVALVGAVTIACDKSSSGSDESRAPLTNSPPPQIADASFPIARDAALPDPNLHINAPFIPQDAGAPLAPDAGQTKPPKSPRKVVPTNGPRLKPTDYGFETNGPRGD